MQNSRKKIIFLDGNYSGGENDGVDGGVVTNASQIGDAGEGQGQDQSGSSDVVAGVGQSRDPSEVSSEAESEVPGEGQSEVARVSQSEAESEVPGLNTIVIEGKAYNRKKFCGSVPSLENPNNDKVNQKEGDGEEGSQTGSQEGSQVGGGDYDYDLLSEGGRSSIDSASVVSSVATNDLLSVDPLYIRLTKFLETSNKMEGGSTANIADLLYDVSSSLKSIKVSFQEINSTLQKLAVTKASQ